MDADAVIRALSEEVMDLRSQLRELTVEEPTTLSRDIARVLNRHNAENESGTPDFLLAEMLVRVLDAFDTAVNERGQWYGHHCRPAKCNH